MKRIAIASCLFAFCLFAFCLFATTLMAQSPDPAPSAQAQAPAKVLPVPQAAVIYQTAPGPIVTTTTQAAVSFQTVQPQAAVLTLPGLALPQPAPCGGNCPQPSLLLATAQTTTNACLPWHPLRKLRYVLKYRR